MQDCMIIYNLCHLIMRLQLIFFLLSIQEFMIVRKQILFICKNTVWKVLTNFAVENLHILFFVSLDVTFAHINLIKGIWLC